MTINHRLLSLNQTSQLLSSQDQKKMKNDLMLQRSSSQLKISLLLKDQWLKDKTKVLINQMSVINQPKVLKALKALRNQQNQIVVINQRVQGNPNQENKRNPKKLSKIWWKVLEKEVQRRSKIFKELSSLIRSKKKKWGKLLKRH